MKKCKYKNSNDEIVTGDFYGIFQYSQVIPPQVFVGGHQGGMKAFPLALVLDEYGMKQILPEDIVSIYDGDSND